MIRQLKSTIKRSFNERYEGGGADPVDFIFRKARFHCALDPDDIERRLVIGRRLCADQSALAECQSPRPGPGQKETRNKNQTTTTTSHDSISAIET